MRRWVSIVLMSPLVVAAQVGDAPKKTRPPTAADAEHRTADVARHRQMAQAHEEAARCLQSGAPEKACQERLREMCKGIAVGQYCGMRHAHLP